MDLFPEHLILHILPFLPTIDTITTSLVSKKWYPLWFLVPSLNFSFTHFPPYSTPSTTSQFCAEFVGHTLIVCRSHSLSSNSTLISSSKIATLSMWIPGFIIQSRIKRKNDLNFFVKESFYVDEPHLRDTYDFPSSVLRNGKVRDLKLTRCDLALPTNLRLLLMKSIYLDEIYLTNQMALNLISGCPNLQVLGLGNCTWIL